MTSVSGMAASIRAATGEICPATEQHTLAVSFSLSFFSPFFIIPYHLSITSSLSEESETFDFAGSNKSTVITTIQSAFTEPLPLTDMIRITFITGAGKLGRSR